MTKTHSLAALTVAAALASGCFGYERESTVGPSATGISALMGTWTSNDVIPAAGQCSDFKWDVTEQTANTASGSFSATCAGDLKINGTARGTLNGAVIVWSAEATASVPGLASCPISLAGTAELQDDSIRVPYSGDTCVGKVNGVEILRRR
ncbi:MAG TPA: hypothetical protein VLD67_05980 [Vicinamibacterales bacterium]|nr:hypothetical protein [Vicinamibacterales bacterium]